MYPTPEEDNPTPTIIIANHERGSPKTVFSLESVKPHPEEPPRMTANKERKISTLYTDTPEV